MIDVTSPFVFDFVLFTVAFFAVFILPGYLIASLIFRRDDFDTIERLPPHISQKIDERVQRAAKKNAAMNLDNYQNLSSRLEFADLREIQDIILSKALWSEFQSLFGNKETLLAKFGQLAELRNGIRHSRTVDEITRKEGEGVANHVGQPLAAELLDNHIGHVESRRVSRACDDASHRRADFFGHFGVVVEVGQEGVHADQGLRLNGLFAGNMGCILGVRQTPARQMGWS